MGDDAPASPEEEALRLVRDALGSVGTIVEAGAHRGTDTVRLARTFPEAKIHAFECVPQLYGRLRRAVAEEAAVRTYPFALAAAHGTRTLHVSSGASDGSSSLFAPDEHLTRHPKVAFEKTISVETIGLDDWARQYRVGGVDFAWLDLQGAELEVLSAAPTMLKSLKAVYTEVSHKPMYAGAPLYPEMNDFMTTAGFTVAMEDFRWDDMGNVLFIRP